MNRRNNDEYLMNDIFTVIETYLNDPKNFKAYVYDYMNLYQSQLSSFGEPMGGILSSMFLDCDEYYPDPIDAAKRGFGKFSIDEHQLRYRTIQKYKLLKEAWNSRNER